MIIESIHNIDNILSIYDYKVYNITNQDPLEKIFPFFSRFIHITAAYIVSTIYKTHPY